MTPARALVIGGVLLGLAARAGAQLVVIDDVILITSRQKKQEQAQTHKHLDPPGGEFLMGPGPGDDTPRLGEDGRPVPPLPRPFSSRGRRRRGRGGEETRLHADGAQEPHGEDGLLSGPLDLPADDDGPADGLTLEAAAERLLAADADLAARYQDIPKARADVLTAGLRSNPLLFVSVGNIPYGSFSPRRPGSTLYDLTVIQPLDINNTRRRRIGAAEQAVEVLEAQYQDAVRREIDRLHGAFVDVLEARQALAASRAGLARTEAVARAGRRRGGEAAPDAGEASLGRASAEIACGRAEAALLRARRELALLLGYPAEQADCLEIRGSLHDRAPPPPCTEELIRMALEARPDLAAYRLGVRRAEADLRRERAEAVDNAFLFYTPFTATDYSPQGKQSATGWGLGLLFPLPFFDRNQGEIARGHVNVTQAQLDLEDAERRVVNEVRYAATEYTSSADAVRQYESEIVPAARALFDETFRRFAAGKESLDSLLEIQEDQDEAVREYLEALVHHRRVMLQLNTAVGRRILP